MNRAKLAGGKELDKIKENQKVSLTVNHKKIIYDLLKY